MEVEAWVKRDIAETGAAAAIVPIGATEQHGPTGLIGTDHMTAEAVAKGVSAATGTLVTPTVNFGMSWHHGEFAGTVTLTPATFVAVVQDVANSLFRSGFTHVLFINGHGGNIGPAYKAFAELKAQQQGERRQPSPPSSSDGEPRHRKSSEDEVSSHVDGGVGGQGAEGEEPHRAGGGGKPTRAKIINWYGGRESGALARELYGNELGQHATPDEVAMTQHLFPASIKTGVALDPAAIQVAKDLKGMTLRRMDDTTGLSVMDPEDFRRRFPDGRMFSNPGLATPDHGRQLLDAAVRDATGALRKFTSGEDIIEEKAAAAAAAAAARAREGYHSRWGDEKASSSGRARKARWGPRTTPPISSLDGTTVPIVAKPISAQ